MVGTWRRSIFIIRQIYLTINQICAIFSSMVKQIIGISIVGLFISSPTHAQVAGLNLNNQALSIQVDSSSGAAVLPIHLDVPPGRAGIGPNLNLVYSSLNRQLGNAGVGWNLDLGAITRSTKKGIPKYDDTDTFMLNGMDMVFDSGAGFYRMEIEGEFSRIEKRSTDWVVTDKKGTKYYYGSTDDSRQNDPGNASRVFRWALSRVEDLKGNYMTIVYMKDGNQVYPSSIQYTGNSQQSLNPYAQVTINYVSTSQKSNSYIAGFNITTAQRIDRVNTSVGSNNQSMYIFTYKQSANTQRDLLASIVQAGSDGVKQIPPVVFTYNEGMPQFQLSSGWNIPSDLALNMNIQTDSGGQVVDAGGRIADLNGDGYFDYVRSYYVTNIPIGPYPKQSYVYLNNKDNGWSLSNNWVLDPNIFPFRYYVNISNRGLTSNNGAILADFNGDGLMDITFSFMSIGDNEQILNSKFYFLFNNINSSFIQDTNWNMPNGIRLSQVIRINCLFDCPTYSTGVIVGDVNGDGFADFIQSKGNQHGAYINQFGQGNKSFNLNSSLNIPSTTYTDFAQGAVPVDLNGDGLADIFYRKAGESHVFMNTDNGWVEDTSSGWNSNAHYGDFTDKGTQMIDVNGDGLVDIFVTTSGNTANAKILLNTGSGWNVYDSSVGDANFFNYGTQFLDANADGMQDYLTYQTGQSPKLYLNQSKPADLLIQVNNGIGAARAIEYDSAFHYSNTFLPFFMPVVKSLTTSVGSENYKTSYSYSGGLWDASNREFWGFKTATVTDPDGNYTQTTFLQDHYLKGRIAEQATYDSAGKLYNRTVNQWQTQNIATNGSQTSKFVFLARTDNFLYDGTATAKRAAQEITYGESPQYGSLTQSINYGEVDADTGVDAGSDKIISKMEYVYNPSIGLMGLPSNISTQGSGGNVVSQSWFYYDKSTNNIPSLGQLTAKINWLGEANRQDPQTLYTYDAVGNLQTTTDPNGNPTSIVYDSTYQMFPVQVTNALNQTTKTAYYGVEGEPLDDGKGLHGLWGQLKSSTDVNNQTTYLVYDSIGRLTAEISSKDSIALPTNQFIYQILSNYVTVISKARVESTGNQTIDKASFYDGLGRLIQTKSLGPNAGQYIVNGQKEYNNRGLPIKSYIPRFTTSDLNTMDAVDTSVPFAQMVYDAIGRVIKTINADGTYASVSYNHWMSTAIDENGHMKKSLVDAFGRLIQKQEYKGADGRSADYPASAFSLYATTNYKYDVLGNLISVTDARNNVTTIAYDRLNRKVSMNDPDMGNWSYGYDTNGNLIWQKDAKTQVISFKYDALNRLLNKTDGITNGPLNNFPNLAPRAPTFNVTYNYDSGKQDFGQGRLGGVMYDNGQAGFTYDEMGRETASAKAIGGVTYNVNRQYDALNRIKQLQYPDNVPVQYLYNQAGQIDGVVDPGVVNQPLTDNNTFKDQLFAWIEKNIFGVEEAEASAIITRPKVSVISPINNSVFLAPASIVLKVSFTEYVRKIEFYNETTLLGTVYGRPYTYTWSNVVPGSYALTAKAYGRNGSIGKSTAVNVTVNQLAPTVNLTAPTDNVSYVGPANIVLRANASTANGTISKVEFYNGTTLLGTATESPYTYTWNNAVPGNHALTAKAYINGVMGVSPVVNVSVNFLPTKYVKHIDYNAQGQMTQVQYGNGTVTTNTYDSLNFRLKRIYTVNGQGEKIQDLNYTYDAIGQIKSITDAVNTATQSFNYDELNRLVTANGTSYGNKIYAYDEIGNITQKDGLTYSYDGNGAGPHAVTYTSDAVSYKYDANGNMATKQTVQGGWSYVYDTQNRLSNIGYQPNVEGKMAKTIAQYFYDGDGGRIKKTVYRYSDFDYSNQETYGFLVTQIGAPSIPPNSSYVTNTTIYVGSLYEIEGNRKTKNVYLGSMRIAAITGTEIAYYHGDHLGSANVITDRTGLARSLMGYDPFGTISRFEKYGSKIPSGWQSFNDKLLDDESGLLFYGGRYYDPKLGRWITPDTVVQAPNDPQTLNRYSYCSNNPVNRVDPTGHSWWSKIFKAVASFFKAAVQIVAYAVLSPIISPIGAGLLIGAISGGLSGGGWSWEGALFGAATGALGGAAFGTTGANGFLGAIGPKVGLGLMAIGGAYSAATGGVEGFANFAATVGGGFAGAGAGNAIVKTQGYQNFLKGIQGGQVAARSAGANTPIGARGNTPQSSLNTDQGSSATGKQALSNKGGFRINFTDSEGNVTSPGGWNEVAPNRGFAGDPELMTLQKGTVIDRFGSPNGEFLSPQGVSAAARSLPSGGALQLNDLPPKKWTQRRDGFSIKASSKTGGVQWKEKAKKRDNLTGSLRFPRSRWSPKAAIRLQRWPGAWGLIRGGFIFGRSNLVMRVKNPSLAKAI